MPAASLQHTLGGCVIGVAWLLGATIEANAAANLGFWDQQPLYPQQGASGDDWVQHPSSLAQDPNYAFDRSLPYQSVPSPKPGISPPFASSYTPAHQNSVFNVSAAQKLSLADLPVDAETTDTVSQSTTVEQAPKARRRPKSTLIEVLVNFLRSPSLLKVVVLVGVMVVSFFLVGVFAKVAQFILGMWLALIALRHLENSSEFS